jgi:hypothetical protein
MIKKLLISGIVGAFIYFLLGWLAYGILFPDTSSGDVSPLKILLGCLFYAFVLAFVFIKYGNIFTFREGFYAGVTLGLLYSLSWYFFHAENSFELQEFIKDILIGTLINGLIGGSIAFTHKKLI